MIFKFDQIFLQGKLCKGILQIQFWLGQISSLLNICRFSLLDIAAWYSLLVSAHLLNFMGTLACHTLSFTHFIDQSKKRLGNSKVNQHNLVKDVLMSLVDHLILENIRFIFSSLSLCDSCLKARLENRTLAPKTFFFILPTFYNLHTRSLSLFHTLKI